MKRKIITILLLTCCFAVCYAAFADLNGKWTANIDTPGGQYPSTYIFKVDGNKLTGTLETAGTVVNIEGGKVNGDEISFSINIQGTDYPHKGKYYAAGDSVAMEIDFGETKVHARLLRIP